MALDKTLPGSYVSVTEMNNAYTGLDLTTLQPGEVARAIRRASSWVDKICRQNLFASQDKVILAENNYPEGYTFDRRTGYLMLFPKQFPINSITSLSYQYGINPVQPTTLDTAFCQIFPRYIMVQTSFLLSHIQPYPDPLLLTLTYLNGYAAALTASPVASGQATATFVPQPGQATVQGFTPGTVVEFQDGLPETMTVLSVSNNVVTFTTNFANTHAADIMAAPLSFAIPQQATINIASYLLKEKGLGPMALHDNAFTSNKQNDLPRDLLVDCEEMLVDYIVYS